uniref:UPAR/Ly6 domain-containing protein n=1 Tax=Strongyloides papillosus TaxID=174720 RepID=A0A0N5C0G0_STREA
MKKLIYKFLSLFLLFKLISGSSLWCHQGGEKEFSPAQCPSTTKECFKFECEGIDSGFVARGCGVDVKIKSVGLKNESCFQAQSICQQLGGISNCFLCSNKYMCNGGPSKIEQFYILIILLTSYIIIANF